MKRKDLLERTDTEKPRASNKTGAFGTFYFRDVYDSFVFTDAERDLWYEDNFLGRTNDAGESIVLLERHLKQMPNKKKTILALPPVVSAWKALTAHMEKAVFRGDVDPEDSLYGKLKPSYGWASAHKWYASYNASLYGAFSGKLMSSKKDRKITDFRGFVDVFVDFAKHSSEKLPFTREGFLLSKNATPHFSGMCVEIAEVAHDRDLKKAQYLADRNFEFFKKAAKRHGFVIDKNAPWRLIPDLDSRGMRRHMKAAGTTKKGFYDKYFVRGYEWELENFKHYLWGWYNNYVNANPVVQILDTAGATTEMKLMERVSYTEEELFSEFSDHFFIKLYIFVRAIETGKDWNQSTYDTVVYKARDLLRLKGGKIAMKYTHLQIKPCDTPSANQIFNKKGLTERETGVILENRIKSKKRNFSYY